MFGSLYLYKAQLNHSLRVKHNIVVLRVEQMQGRFYKNEENKNREVLLS